MKQCEAWTPSPLLSKYWLICSSWFDFLHFCRFVRFGLWTHEKCRYGHPMVLFFRVCLSFQSLNNFLECWPIDGPHSSCFLVCWLSMDSAVHNLWHGGLSMDRTVHVICGRWVIYRSWDAGWEVLGAEPSKVYECHAVIWDTSVASEWSTAKLEPPP